MAELVIDSVETARIDAILGDYFGDLERFDSRDDAIRAIIRTAREYRPTDRPDSVSPLVAMLSQARQKDADLNGQIERLIALLVEIDSRLGIYTHTAGIRALIARELTP